MSSYPLPAYAISIWIAGDSLMVAFPGTVTEQGHTIKLPASAAGLKTALDIAKQRAEAQDLRLGQRGTPTQYEIERRAGAAWGAATKRLREEHMHEIEAKLAKREAERTAKVRRAAREREEAAAFLAELGL